MRFGRSFQTTYVAPLWCTKFSISRLKARWLGTPAGPTGRLASGVLSTLTVPCPIFLLSPSSVDCSGASSANAATASVTIAVSTSAPSMRGRSPNQIGAREKRDSLALGKAVAGSADGDDQVRVLRRRLELLAQVADVHVDRA